MVLGTGLSVKTIGSNVVKILVPDIGECSGQGRAKSSELSSVWLGVGFTAFVDDGICYERLACVSLTTAVCTKSHLRCWYRQQVFS